MSEDGYPNDILPYEFMGTFELVKFETVSDEGYPNEILPYEFMRTFSFTLNW